MALSRRDTKKRWRAPSKDYSNALRSIAWSLLHEDDRSYEAQASHRTRDEIRRVGIGSVHWVDPQVRGLYLKEPLAVL